MEQTPLFITSLEAALHAVGSRTGGYKKLCCAICPEHANDPDEAQKKVSRKLNKKAKEVFSDADMDAAIQYGKAHDCHFLKWWKDDMHGYKNSDPVDGKSELLKIKERQAALATEQVELQARADQLSSK